MTEMESRAKRIDALTPDRSCLRMVPTWALPDEAEAREERLREYRGAATLQERLNALRSLLSNGR